jgi:DNA-binding transcriptional LysR family regulator
VEYAILAFANVEGRPMRFDLIDLRLFIAIVDLGSISKGADATHMALASASARVSGMEAALGTALLERQSRGVLPTNAGRTLLHHARLITAQTEHMRADLQAFSSGLKRQIRMFSNTAAMVELLPATLRDFLAAYPDVDVDIVERTSADIAIAVAEGRAEFGLVADSADTQALQTRPLLRDRLAVLVSRAHPLASRSEVDFAELLDEPFVGLGSGALHDHLASHAARLGRQLTYRVRLKSFEAVAGLVEAGVGIAILPQAAIERSHTPGAVTLALADAWADRQLLVCAADFEKLTEHARLFVSALENQARSGRLAT